jgi:hypothetical protein
VVFCTNHSRIALPGTSRSSSIFRPSHSIPIRQTFLYQINRPRASQTGIPSLRINRLTKWSVAILVHLSGTDVTRLSEVSQRHACRMEFDINTTPDFGGPLPQGAFPALLGEFTALVRELAEHGDVK